MDINRSNYETFFLDYAEGNLSFAEEEILRRFLKFNPDLLIEFDAFEIHPIHREDEVFPNKESLKKNFPGEGEELSVHNFDMYCIAFLEGDLSEEQCERFEIYLSEHPEYAFKLELYKKTFLQKEEIHYPQKSRLKRRKIIQVNWRIIMPVAAAAAIALMFIIGPDSAQDEVFQQLALIEEQKSNEVLVQAAVEDKKPVTNDSPASIRVIRGSKAPVPVTDYKKKEKDENKGYKENDPNEKKVAETNTGRVRLDLQNRSISAVNPRYDQIVHVAISSPPIHPGSLSLPDLVRYQYQKATSAVEEEDVFFWNLASNGLKELNKIIGSDAQLLASRDEEGAISGIQFRSRRLNFTTPISRGSD